MRWFVEVAEGSHTAAERWVVEAAHWQPALKEARSLRGELGETTGFSVELLEDGFRAIDPSTLVRYVLRQAPEDAPLSKPAGANGHAAANHATTPAAPSPSPAPSPSVETTAAPKAPAASPSVAPVKSAAPAPSVAPQKAAAPQSVSPAKAAAPKPVAAPAAEPVVPRAAPSPRPVASAASSPPASVPAPSSAAVPVTAAPVAAVAPSAPAPRPQEAPVSSAAPAPGSVAPPSHAAPRAPTNGTEPLPPAELLYEREEDASPASRLTYRESAWLVPEGTTIEAATRLLMGTFEGVRAALAGVKPGKLVNMAVFDHRFEGKPQRPPIITLTWKDWQDRGQGPELRRPSERPPSLAPGPSPSIIPPAPGWSSTGAAAPAAQPIPLAPAVPSVPRPIAHEEVPATMPSAAAPVPVEVVAPTAPPLAPAAAVPAPAPVSVAPPAPVAAPASVPAPAVPVAAAAPAPAPAPVEPALPEPPAAAVAPAEPVVPLAPEAAAAPAAPVVAPAAPAPVEPVAPIPSAPPPSEPAVARQPSTPSVRRRLVGEELIADLFEAMHDLHFLRGPLEGADFVLSLVMDKLPSQIGLVHFYDIDAREFVVVRAIGPGAEKLRGSRTSEKEPVVAEAMRKRRAVVIVDTSADPSNVGPRWAKLEMPARSIVCAPVELAGRFLGLLELCNPRDDNAFGEGDGHALTYIGEQFAEFLGTRTIVLEPKSRAR